jgi:hypothetical protein
MTRQWKRDLRRRKNRRTKLHSLRGRLEKTTDPQVRRRLIAKMKKISPDAPVPAK